jgi:hypothetical protein
LESALLERTVQNITILDELITVKGHRGAGIGAGFGNSLVNRLEIQGDEVRAEIVFGAGIGSRSANASGQKSQIDIIQVRGGNVTTNSLNGSEIGSVQAISNGNSILETMEITHANVTAVATHGSGIGSGFANGSGSSSSVGNPTVSFSTLNGKSLDGASIGSGNGVKKGLRVWTAL